MKGFISTGEFSGEVHGAEIVKLIDFPMYGIGGERLRDRGVRIIGESKAIVGFREVPRRIFYFLNLREKVFYFLKKERPSFVLLIDFPGFNMVVGEFAGSLGIPVFYFLPPQIWAWGRWRARKVRRWVSKVFVFFDFERRMWEEEGVEVECTGFPWKRIERKVEEIIGVFPGSREVEVRRNLPFMLDILKGFMKKMKIFVCIPWEKERMEDGIFYTPSKEEVLSCARFAISKPGTITLELALSGIPSVITSNVPLVDRIAGRMLLYTEYISLPNILLGKEVYPEVFEKKRVKDMLFLIMEEEELIKKELLPIYGVVKDGVYEKVYSSILSFFNH